MKYKKRLTWVVILSIVITFLLTGCASKPLVTDDISSNSGVDTSGSTKSNSETVVSPDPNSESSSTILKSVLAKYTTNEIRFFKSFLNGDNQYEAFATVNSGEVWYITDSYAQRLKTGLSFTEGDQSETSFLWTFDDVIIFKCEDIPGGSSSVSYAWYVKDGKPVELNNTGMNLSHIGNGQFTTIGESFDLNITDGIAAGHTYKSYYLYWAGDHLNEYGGIKITLEQLKKVDGAKAVIDVITKSGYIIDEIYYRANNIININYHSGDKDNRNFDNVTLLYNNNTVTPELVYPTSNNSKTEIFSEKNLSSFSYGGIYQKAFYPDIATYVDSFAIN
jgi:hypothetical protein